MSIFCTLFFYIYLYCKIYVDIYGTTSTNNPPPSPTYTLKTDENELLPIMYVFFLYAFFCNWSANISIQTGIYISMRYTSNYN